MKNTKTNHIAKVLMRTPIAIRYFSQQELIDILNMVGLPLNRVVLD